MSNRLRKVHQKVPTIETRVHAFAPQDMASGQSRLVARSLGRPKLAGRGLTVSRARSDSTRVCCTGPTMRTADSPYVGLAPVTHASNARMCVMASGPMCLNVRSRSELSVLCDLESVCRSAERNPCVATDCASLACGAYYYTGMVHGGRQPTVKGQSNQPLHVGLRRRTRICNSHAGPRHETLSHHATAGFRVFGG